MREILWTERSEDYIAAHAITPGEVEQVVNARPRLVLVGREETEYVFGTTDAGRHVPVVLVEAMDGRDYVVTAREMTDSEHRTFRRRGRWAEMSTLDKLAEHAQTHDFSAEMEHGVWETHTEADPMVTTSLRLPKSLLDWVREQAVSQHVRPSALIRQWVEQHREDDGEVGVEDVAARLERLEHAVFSDAQAS